MKTICFALFILVEIALASRAVAVTGNHVYLQVSPIYAIPGNDIETRSGVALALGTSVDEYQGVELEGIAFSTAFKQSKSASHSEESDLKFRHALATYRYVVPVRDTFRVFAGLSAGMAYVSYEITTVDRNVIVAAGYSGGAIGYLVTNSPNGGRSNLPVLPQVSNYYPLDGTYTRSYSGSNTVAAGGPQLGFEYDVAPQSTIAVSARWLYMAKTDVMSSGGITFVQAAFRYSF